MLKIGFSNKYFTLWNVETTTEFTNVGGFALPYQRTVYCYLKNLSMTEEEALKKASFLGCEDLDVDVELYGRNASFDKKREMFSRIPSDKSFFFEFGKIKDTKIQDCNDSDYLFWYLNETQNIHCRERLIAEFGFVDFNGQLVHQEHATVLIKRERIIQQVLQDGRVFGVMVGNLSEYGGGSIEVEENVVLGIRFNEFKVCDYNGHKYGLPVKNGKGKRVKGHSIEVVVNNHDGNGNFDVVSFEVFKNQIIY